MHFRLNKYLIEQSTKFLRRVFSYNSTWSNKDIEIIQLSSGSSTSIFEQYFNEEEKYPVISIGTSGGTYGQSSFSDLWKMVDDDKFPLGNRGLNTLVISDTKELQVIIPSASIKEETLRGIDISLAWTGEGTGGDDIQVNVYKDFSTTPILIGSSSIKGNTDNNLNTYFCEFNENISLVNQNNIAITLKVPSTGSSYHIMMDTTNGSYFYNDNSLITSGTGNIVGNLYFPAFVRMGGNFQSTLNFKVQAKNNTAIVYSLTELMAMYFTLAKHGQISRSSTSTNGIRWSDSDISIVSSELTEKGIFVKSIKQSGLEVRRRGEKDIVFGMTLSIDFFTEWFEDYSLDTIKNIEVISNSFIENLNT